MSDLVTITGARAYVLRRVCSRELASSVAADERVVVAGGAYGIEGASHQAVLAAGGDTIAILANGLIAPTRLAIATCSTASPMSAFSLAKFRPAPFRPDTGSSPRPPVGGAVLPHRSSWRRGARSGSLLVAQRSCRTRPTCRCRPRSSHERCECGTASFAARWHRVLGGGHFGPCQVGGTRPDAASRARHGARPPPSSAPTRTL